MNNVNKTKPLKKIVSRFQMPTISNGLIVLIHVELLECGHFIPKKRTDLGPFEALYRRRCPCCSDLKLAPEHSENKHNPWTD